VERPGSSETLTGEETMQTLELLIKKGKLERGPVVVFGLLIEENVMTGN